MEMNMEREEYVDWKGRVVEPTRHGGTRGASFVCVTEILENMVFISNASNLVTYFSKSMHYSLAESSNMLTNYMGTCFMLTLFGGFISDSFFTRFSTFMVLGSLELLGLIILMIQAFFDRFQPKQGTEPSLSQGTMLFTGLYFMAVGVGGVKSSLPAHGGDQFDHSEKTRISRFFNWFFFSLCMGGLLAVTILVWIQENKGWKWGFGVSASVLVLALIVFASGCKFYRHKVPTRSPFTRIYKVLVSACKHWHASSIEISEIELHGKLGDRFKFLNKAALDEKISAIQIQETKTFLSLLPIFASTIMMNCCLAQLQTFSVQQGASMNKTLIGNFQIPPASLTTIPLIIMLISVPIYDRVSTTLSNKLKQNSSLFFTPLRRIGVGLLLASGSMLVALAIEVKRKKMAEKDGILSVFWLGFQYLLLSVSDMFTLAGMLEFFFSEAPKSMRSVSTALSWCSTSMGYFLSSVLVSVTNSASMRYGSQKWLGSNNLNENRLELFYGLLAVLNLLNFINYVLWAKWY